MRDDFRFVAEKLRIIDSLLPTLLTDRSTQRVATLKHGRFKMSCDLQGNVAAAVLFFRHIFPRGRYCYCCREATAKRAKVVLDVGANAGIYSVSALAVQPDVVV